MHTRVAYSSVNTRLTVSSALEVTGKSIPIGKDILQTFLIHRNFQNQAVEFCLNRNSDTGQYHLESPQSNPSLPQYIPSLTSFPFRSWFVQMRGQHSFILPHNSRWYSLTPVARIKHASITAKSSVWLFLLTSRSTKSENVCRFFPLEIYISATKTKEQEEYVSFSLT